MAGNPNGRLKVAFVSDYLQATKDDKDFLAIRSGDFSTKIVQDALLFTPDFAQRESADLEVSRSCSGRVLEQRHSTCPARLQSGGNHTRRSDIGLRLSTETSLYSPTTSRSIKSSADQQPQHPSPRETSARGTGAHAPSASGSVPVYDGLRQELHSQGDGMGRE
jgi:hypothetical protein